MTCSISSTIYWISQKLNQGQLPVHIENCNIENLFSEIKTFFAEQQDRLNKNNIDFDLIICDQLRAVTIATDRVKLKQILINLISNSFKFTKEGRIVGGCRTGENNQIVFYVSDRGIGIPHDKHQFIFERFSQIYNNELYVGGTGLGLSIVKGLVTLLGGNIWLESEPGKGSTFYFTIEFKNPVHNFPHTHETLLNSDFIFRDKTILVIEDDPFNTDYINEILSGKELQITLAKNGKKP
ncbi:MAG: hypothetical protein HC906_15255 [Bacteroidales bacterium]|nr:hypothetical protein [Bacteroidales bacterium]